MIKARISGATYSSIVGIGEKIAELSAKTGMEYLPLNRGVNAVTLLALDEVIHHIPFTSQALQVYPPNKGRPTLRKAIHEQYLHNTSHTENIFITPGGMAGLDMIMRSLAVDTFVFPLYFWGSYAKVALINNQRYDVYSNFEELFSQADWSNKAVVICDPNNPIGNSFSDAKLLQVVELITSRGGIIIWDSPYRALFREAQSDTLWENLATNPNVIINESFSKSMGLSGQRIGFIHSTSEEFNKELNINLLYTANGVNAFAQLLVETLLTTDEGKKAVADFRRITTDGIAKNIAFLRSENFLAEEFYRDSDPVGIFAIVNISHENLMDNRIGSVPLSFFTTVENKKNVEHLSRICVSVASDKFAAFFSPLSKQ